MFAILLVIGRWRYRMLHISFSQLTSKRHVILNETSISLPIGKSVLLQGDKDVVSTIFTHILYQKQCEFTLEDEVLDKDLLKHNIILLSSDGPLPMMKKVKTLFFELGFDLAQCDNLLRNIDLESKSNWHIFRLSKEDRLLLSVQLACASQASILLLDKDWTTLSISCQNMITKLLEKYLAESNFILINQGAKNLISCDEQYDVIGQNIESKQEHSFSFLEEKGTIDKTSAKKQAFLNQIKSQLSFLSFCENALFYLLSILFVTIALIVVFGFSSIILQLDGHLEKEKEKQGFTTRITVCTLETTPYTFCSNDDLSSEQLDILNSIDEVEQLYPIHEISMLKDRNNSFDENSGFFADGVLVPQDENTSILYSGIDAYDSSLFAITERFSSDENSQKGLYISEQYVKNNQALFDSVKGKKLTIRATFLVPAYVQIDNTGMAAGTMFLPVEDEIPILGVVNSDSYKMSMGEEEFFQLQDKAQQLEQERSSKDSVVYNKDYEIYKPKNYQMLIHSYDDILIVQEKLKSMDPTIKLSNDPIFTQSNRQRYVESQTQLRNILLPVLLVVAVLIGAYLGVSYRFKKFNFLYEFQHQRINVKWKLRITKNIIFICLFISALSILMIVAVSSISFQEMITSSIMNSSYAQRQNIYESQFFITITSLFELFQMYSNSLHAFLVILLFSSCIGVLRYAPTLYCYMKSRKQM